MERCGPLGGRMRRRPCVRATAVAVAGCGSVEHATTGAGPALPLPRQRRALREPSGLATPLGCGSRGATREHCAPTHSPQPPPTPPPRAPCQRGGNGRWGRVRAAAEACPTFLPSPPEHSSGWGSRNSLQLCAGWRRRGSVRATTTSDLFFFVKPPERCERQYHSLVSLVVQHNTRQTWRAHSDQLTRHHRSATPEATHPRPVWEGDTSKEERPQPVSGPTRNESQRAHSQHRAFVHAPMTHTARCPADLCTVGRNIIGRLHRSTVHKTLCMAEEGGKGGRGKSTQISGRSCQSGPQ